MVHSISLNLNFLEQLICSSNYFDCFQDSRCLPGPSVACCCLLPAACCLLPACSGFDVARNAHVASICCRVDGEDVYRQPIEKVIKYILGETVCILFPALFLTTGPVLEQKAFNSETRGGQ